MKKDFKKKRGEKREYTQVEEEWFPKTLLGKKVQSGETTDIDSILTNNIILREPQIAEKLIPNL